ncbi:MAG: hypothetical protein ACM3N9_08575 [Syntrophothermus sp.]
MRFNKLLLLTVLPLFLISCSKDFKVNAEWKEVPVVYGLLNQNDSVHYIKITRAFLGEGDALMYAQIPDSSNYPVGDLQVRVEGWKDNLLKQTLVFHDTLVQNKDTGIFYAPTQLVYTSGGTLNEEYTYKLFVKNLKSNLEITSQTDMVRDFAIENPGPPPATLSFMTGKKTFFSWYPAKNGTRYEVSLKFHYLESIAGGPYVEKILDWVIFSDLRAEYEVNAQAITRSLPGESFYNFLHSKLVADPDIQRTPGVVEVIFTVASPDLNTYMDVTEPSNTIVQERPSFTNITNGIGLFASRYNNTKKRPIVIELSPNTKAELKTNPLTAGLNF